MSSFPGFSSLRAPACGLLGLALATACSDDGLANQSSGQAETSATGAPATSGTTGADEGPVSATVQLEGTESPPGTTGGPADDSSGTLGPQTVTGTTSSTGTSDDTTGTTGGPSQACADGCVVEFACGTEWASEDDCVAWCEANLVKAAGFSPFCAAAWEGVSACLATLTCEEFAQWQNPMVFPYPCSNADVVLSIECKGQ
jgi:hypothetical protein